MAFRRFRIDSSIYYYSLKKGKNNAKKVNKNTYLNELKPYIINFMVYMVIEKFVSIQPMKGYF